MYTHTCACVCVCVCARCPLVYVATRPFLHNRGLTLLYLALRDLAGKTEAQGTARWGYHFATVTASATAMLGHAFALSSWRHFLACAGHWPPKAASWTDSGLQAALCVCVCVCVCARVWCERVVGGSGGACNRIANGAAGFDEMLHVVASMVRAFAPFGPLPLAGGGDVAMVHHFINLTLPASCSKTLSQLCPQLWTSSIRAIILKKHHQNSSLHG